MTALSPTHSRQSLVDQVTDIVNQGSQIALRNLMQTLYPAEATQVLEALSTEARIALWAVMPPAAMAEIMAIANPPLAAHLLAITDRKDLLTATASMAATQRADWLHRLPEPLLSQVMETLAIHQRSRFDDAVSYDAHTAGGLMSRQVLTIRADVSLDVVSRYLRLRGKLPVGQDSLIVVDRQERFQGLLPLSQLVTHDPHTLVQTVMDTRNSGVSYRMTSRDVAVLFEQRHLLSAAVLDDDSRVVGCITLDAIVGLIRDEANHSLMSMAGLPEQHDLFAPITASAQRRALWLGVNLLTAFLAAAVIDVFESTLQQVIALAVLMPIVASMGGIAGSQTLTLVVRGLALRQVTMSNAGSLLLREMAVGLLNGVVWAMMVAAVAGFWFHDASIGVLLGTAMLINLLCAAVAGVFIPVLLDKLGVDPALAGGVLLTTITDVVGFTAFLGLATIWLL
jgi:magnesium transporter